MKQHLKITSIICLFALSALLVACVKLHTSINVSDLLSDEDIVLTVDLGIRDDNCPSDSIKSSLEEKGVPAQFHKCEEDGRFLVMGMFPAKFAMFTLPTALVKNNNQPNSELGHIYFRYKNNKLFIETSNNIASKFNKDQDLQDVSFDLVNDTDQKVTISSSMIYVNNKATLNESVTIEPFDSVKITISNVASKLLEQNNQQYQVFSISTDSE